MASDSTAQRGDSRRPPFKRLPLSSRPTSSDVLTSHRLGHIFKSIFNYADCNALLRSPSILLSHERQPALHTELWRHFTAAFTLKFGGFGGALNLQTDDGLISLSPELNTYSDRLRHIFRPHSRRVSDHDLHPPSFYTSEDSPTFSSGTARCEPALVRAVFVDSFGEAPSTHSPGSNEAFSKPQDTAQDTLRSLLLRDPLARGQDYLRRNAGNLYSQTTQSIKPGEPLKLLENFSQLLILETTNDP